MSHGEAGGNPAGLRAVLERLGLPQVETVAASPPPTSTGASSLAAGVAPGRADRARATVALLTIATTNYLPYARVLAASVARFHPEVDVYVVLTDWDQGGTPEVGHAFAVAIEQLGVEQFGVERLPFLRLRFSAAQLCQVAKPAVCAWGAGLGYEKVLYCDADIELFAPLTALLAALGPHRFVAVPHVVAPFPYPERRHEHPTMPELAAAGVLNTGLFGFLPDAESRRFLATWQDLALAPGCVHQAEQTAFNWLAAFLDGAFVLRDTAYNVAYWNLHDRSLRWCGLDGGDADAWLVDGKPLVAFHFSGLPFDHPERLSVFDFRHSLYLLPSVAMIVERYVRALIAHGMLAEPAGPYRFDRLPSGVAIDARMRQVFGELDHHLAHDLDPFTPAGERSCCRALLAPQAGTFMVPALLWCLWRERPDLQAHFPEARSRPQRLQQWFATEGAAALGYGALFDRFRPTIAKREPTLHLDALRERLPVAFDDLQAPLGADRTAFIERLQQAGLDSEANGVRGLDTEWWPWCGIDLVRQLVATRPDLQQNFPDFLDHHADALADWLASDGVVLHGLEPDLGTLFRRKAGGRALGRVYSYYRRHPRLMESWPFAFLGEGCEELALDLLEHWPEDCEFDRDDVAMYLWEMALRPWVGVAATLEAPVHGGRQPSPLLPEGQEALLAPFLGRAPGFRRELADYRRRQAARGFVASRSAANRAAVAGLPARMPHPALVGAATPRGVNCFGYFASPIGLGSLSRGLERVLRHASFAVARNVQGTLSMDSELRLADLVETYRYDFDTNVFVSFPHLHHDLLRALSPAMRRGRNIVYLAWEQRDFHPWWREVFADFDQIWALSEFAAEAIGRGCGREVLAVPAAIDFTALPPAARKEDAGLDPRRFSFLYVFDAASSIERKNPAAAIAAFRRAFAPGDPVELVIKVANADAAEHRRQLARVREQAAQTQLDVRFVTDTLPRPGLLGLISAADCYVSLHRAEGFGLTCAEAMAYGVPVIVTGYSGNLDFMDAASAYLVRASEVEVTVRDGPFERGSVWAEPDVGHAAELMRQVYEERDTASRVGRRGAQLVRERLAVERVAALLARALG